MLAILFAYALGAVLLPKLPLPLVFRLALGAAFLSLLEFLLLQLHAGSFPYLAGFFLIALAIYRPPAFQNEPAVLPLDAVSRWIFFPLLGAYGIFYLVNALAPEIQPDAVVYHLALPAEYLRLGAFPGRMGFYEALPQGMEMLFAIAIAHGGYSSAKLVHFTFLLASLPALVLLARRLRLPDLAGAAAAVLYFTAPVVGVSGTSAYNDAALVFFTLTAFYLLLPNTGASRFAAGVAAGFCFAIKPTGLLVPALALLYFAWKRRPPFLFAAGAVLMILPWMGRDFLITGNPLAPLLNSVFPNPFFSPATERILAKTLTTYAGFHWSMVPWQWAFGGGFEGVGGPLIFLLPLALFAWLKREARAVLVAGLLLLVPLCFNLGTRFVMPSLAFLALAICAGLPRPLIWACVLLQAAFSVPPLIKAANPNSWALSAFPWRAALRITPPEQYLAGNAGGDYQLARMVETATAPADRVFALTTIANAYTTREVSTFWHSNRARQLTEALRAALGPPNMDILRAEWPPRRISSFRILALADLPSELRVFETNLYARDGAVSPSRQWFVRASPNLWDAPLALDANRATFWGTLEPRRAGMFWQVDFGSPLTLDAARLLVQGSGVAPAIRLDGRERSSGPWILLADAFRSSPAQPPDLKREAIRALKSASYTYLLAPGGADGLGPIGQDMAKHPREWGLEKKATLGDVNLFRLL